MIPERPADVSFVVPGPPVPKGSMRGMVSKSTGRVIMLPSGGAKETRWMAVAKVLARQAAAGVLDLDEAGDRVLLDGPIAVFVSFLVPRPKTVTRSLPITRGLDCDKGLRAVLDALTGSVITDDAQVIEIETRKRYAMDQPSTSVQVWALTEQEARQ